MWILWMFFVWASEVSVSDLSWDAKIKTLHQSKAQSLESAKLQARKWVTDESLLVRAAAVEVLSQNPDSEDLKALWSVIEDQRNWHKGSPLFVWYMAAQTLMEKEPDRVSEIIQKLRTKKSPSQAL